MLTRIRSDVERNARRARNGLKYVGGVDRPQVGRTPKDVVWKRDKAELWHYRSDAVDATVRYRPPVLIVMSLVSRSYVLDLFPGNSFVETLMKAGLDVYLAEWGVADEADSENTLETYTTEYLPRMVRETCRDAGSEDVTVLGYCYGGVLALLMAAADPGLPIRNFMAMATPTDFTQMGLTTDLVRSGRLSPEDMIDDSGNVPPDAIRNGFRVVKPTSEIASYANMWENLWNDEYMEGYQAMGQWSRDHGPFPGATFKQTAQMLIKDNGFITDRLRMHGKKISLKSITCPFINIIAEKDHIVPVAAAEQLTSLVGSTEAEELRLKAGHVGLVAGRTAAKVTIPKIIEWIQTHSDELAAAPA
ncbi:MAG: alpha/beta fold hydrolase [Mycobacteriales bacterium]